MAVCSPLHEPNLRDEFSASASASHAFAQASHPRPNVTSWCSEGSTNGHRSSCSYGFSLFRGRPPLAPLALAAAALAFDRLRPPRRPVAAANRRLPNARSTRPGTYTSTPSDGHDNASLAGEITIDSIADADARCSPGTAFRGMAIDPPPP